MDVTRFLIPIRTKTELTANIVDEDPAGCQRWISRKEI